MPKDLSIRKVLLIGSGPIVISQGCEFDYSGTQSCKALKEEGCEVILINPNPATIMTDPSLADSTYIEPLVPEIIEKIIIKERPDSILPTMGGQTALNCTLELETAGVLAKYNIKLIGVSIDTIKKTEDRKLFNDILKNLKLDHAASVIVKDLAEVRSKAFNFAYPKLIRTSYSLGGTGSGLAYNEEELIKLCEQAFRYSPSEILIEESLMGWKEFELEVMADAEGNFIVVCPIENFDPMGIHTGDSITIAPAQTLTDKEYQIMRNTACLLMREIGMTSGGCNIQFAVQPHTGRLAVIEINPRVSRSSALASKATGFPIAKIATKIALGYNLNELSNNIVKSYMPASFEPSIDYTIVKIPKFNFDKFPGAVQQLTTQMKSIGEVMGIGRTFPEALQKALRSLENGANGFTSKIKEGGESSRTDTFIQKLTIPSEDRIFYIADAYRENYSTETIHQYTHIDPWFLSQIKDLIEIEKEIKNISVLSLSYDDFIFLKRKGFSDNRIAELTNTTEMKVYEYRKSLDIYPSYKLIDSCAAEFPSETAYFYSTYEKENEALANKNKKIVIIGSGPNRIGQGIEFDYCCVHAMMSVREAGYEGIMINCNPETVSTDYDCSDRLFFEPLTLENVRDILHNEKPDGIMLQFGGQTPLLLSQQLEAEQFPILGTNSKGIELAENRAHFKNLLSALSFKQPNNDMVENKEQAISAANIMGYPLILRPSYILGGKNLKIVNNKHELSDYFSNELITTGKILIEKVITDAVEIDVDAICDGNDVFVCGITQQFERAGIHSGDSTCIIPALDLSEGLIDQVTHMTREIALKLEIIGFINIQFLLKENELYALEANPRASRTIPFLSKASGVAFVKIATRVILGIPLKVQGYDSMLKYPFIAIKKPVFSFNKLPHSSQVLGPEMKSTGEVMAIGQTLEEAFLKLSLYEKKFICTEKELHKLGIYSLQSYSSMY